MPLAGWVFRIEVITSDVAKPTKKIIGEIEEAIKNIPAVEKVQVKELYEDITLFKKKERSQKK